MLSTVGKGMFSIHILELRMAGEFFVGGTTLLVSKLAVFLVSRKRAPHIEKEPKVLFLCVLWSKLLLWGNLQISLVHLKETVSKSQRVGGGSDARGPGSGRGSEFIRTLQAPSPSHTQPPPRPPRPCTRSPGTALFWKNRGALKFPSFGGCKRGCGG